MSPWRASQLKTGLPQSAGIVSPMIIDEGVVTKNEHLIAFCNISAPVYNDIELDIEHVRVDGELWWDENNIFRQDPSPETDQAWEDLIGGEANRILVSKEDWVKTGLDPEVGAQWVGDPTGQTYMAEINVFHLIHCLDMLRRGAFMDYYE